MIKASVAQLLGERAEADFGGYGRRARTWAAVASGRRASWCLTWPAAARAA